MSKKYLLLTLVVALALSLAACSAGKKTAATNAIQAAETAFNAVKAELMGYVPDEAKAVEDTISIAKEALNTKNYAAALAAAKGIPDKIKELTALAESKKTEMTAAWQGMSVDMPKMLDEIKTKLDALSKTRRLPANLDKAKLEGAKSAYDGAAAMWQEAQTAFSAGNVADAMAKATTVKDQVVQVMTTLGMQPPTPTTTG